MLNSAKEVRSLCQFFIDSKQVQKVDVSALIYLIAIIDRIRSSNDKVVFRGNLPVNSDARNVFTTSGFLNYFKNNYKGKDTDTNVLKILRGVDADPKAARDVCAFIIGHFGLKMKDTLDLYAVLIELMTNTQQHAYTERAIFNYWFLFVEYRLGKANFVFLDTGEGIPNTVRKKLTEKIFEKLPNGNDDANLIKTALLGDEFRSQTGEPYRGKGLPQVNKYFKRDNVQNALVCSERGECIMNDVTYKEYYENNLKDTLRGTLFAWQVAK